MEQPGYEKLVRFCLYRERCVSEVTEKLRSTDVPESDYGKILRKLQEEGYLDEKRFAMAFARDKFNLKKWGRKKIAYELQARRLPAPLIHEAVYALDDEAYERTLQVLIERKQRDLVGEKDPRVRKAKLVKYLVSKGYEYDLVSAALRQA